MANWYVSQKLLWACIDGCVAAECVKKRVAQEIGNGRSVRVTTMKPLCILFYSTLFYYYIIQYFRIKVCYVKNVADVKQNIYYMFSKSILHIFH
jgi:hypothetical protein